MPQASSKIESLSEAQARAQHDPASFRDPGGFAFRCDGILYRAILPGHRAAYDRLLGSGAYTALVQRGALIEHVALASAPSWAYKIIAPTPIPFISYPFEWSFGQLRDAALLTLEVMREALRHDMWLKDASAYNVQFLAGRPVLIDTLSLEPYPEGSAWPAYHQFCRHFLAPLALMSWRDARLLDLARAHMDGVPLDLASALLPWRTRLSPGIGLHLHAQSRLRGWLARREEASGGRPLAKRALENILSHLQRSIAGLARPRPVEGAGWTSYADTHSYAAGAMAQKTAFVSEVLQRLRPGMVYDLGANTGAFSTLAAKAAGFVLAVDQDAAAVDEHYAACRARGVRNVLPLVMDLANPSPPLGWESRERPSFAERGRADLVLALALVHHLAIGRNIPLPMIARFLAALGGHAVVEFVPKRDPMLARMLAGRADVFRDYGEEHFERSVASHFETVRKLRLDGSERTLYWLQKRSGAPDRAS
jgi:ribosomal protein L11 methylase PrmA